MAQKTLAVQGTSSDLQPDDNKVLMVFLVQAIRPPVGFTFHVATAVEPKTLFGGVISDVRVNSAWISFTHDKVIYRTDTINDRNNFKRWYTGDTQEAFSHEKGLTDKFGPPNVTFLRIGLASEKTSEVIVEKKVTSRKGDFAVV